MTEKQIKILENNDYEVISSINYVRYKNNDYPIAYVDFDKKEKKFHINILRLDLTTEKEILNAENEITKAFNLVKLLNNN